MSDGYDLHDLLRRIEPVLADGPAPGNRFTSILPDALDVAARVAEFDTTDRFGAVRHELIAWTGRHGAGELRSLFASFSPWRALPEERRTAALDGLEHLAVEQFGGLVQRPYLRPVYLAQRR